MAKVARKLKVVETPKILKLDIGCGRNKREGFTGVDQYEMDGVDIVQDLCKEWQWEDGSVDEVHCSHFIEHLTNMNGRWERIHFFNELHRVLKPGGQAQIILPHWCSNRYYGDPTHCEPFSEMGFYYLNQVWRKAQAPHSDSFFNKDGYKCDFDFTCGYSMHQTLLTRNQEYQQFALGFYKEAAQDMIAMLTKFTPQMREEAINRAR